MRLHRAAIALLAAVLSWAACYALRQIPPVPPAVLIEGSFTPGGQYPGVPLALASSPRAWGSWAGSDEREGVLRIGPFPAPAQLRIAVGGYPHHPGNDLYLEMPLLGIRWPLAIGDVGERWETKEFELPLGWRGWPVVLTAVDHAHDFGGWLAVSEPLGGGAIAIGPGATLVAWLCDGVLLGLCFAAAARWLTQRAWLPASWVAVAAGGVVALGGYAAFWVYFANATLGKIFSWALLGGALVVWLTAPAAGKEKNAEWRGVLKLLACVGVFYLGLLHLFAAPRGFYDLAANRFVEALPGDNRLPHDVASRLDHGDSLKSLSPDWLASDRPPLQSGWQLLTWPATAALGFDEATASGATSVWLQLLWVAAAYGLLRTLGLGRARACAWVAVLALSGFFLQNTMFTWPKLAAAAFACAAFALWMRPLNETPPRSRLLCGAVLAALAWLAHGGVAFSLLALVPWIAWRALRGEVREWALAAVVFALLVLPWMAYQKYSDPPGNRLVKMHLAGQIEIDSRGTWQTIQEAYLRQSWHETAAAKLENFKLLVAGDWRQLFDLSAANAPARRRDEFFHTARALTWWLLGLVALPLIALQRNTRARIASKAHTNFPLAAWTGLTVAIWCLLMFNGGQTVIHQGSYAVMLTLFALLTAWLDGAGRWWIFVVAGLQGLTLMTTWAPANSTVNGETSIVAVALTLAGTLALAAFVTAGIKPESRKPSQRQQAIQRPRLGVQAADDRSNESVNL